MASQTRSLADQGLLSMPAHLVCFKIKSESKKYPLSPILYSQLSRLVAFESLSPSLSLRVSYLCFAFVSLSSVVSGQQH
jgi:hypothetical protein